jgi:UDP-glucose 4-epimerase
MKILVTGGAGYIGSFMVKRLLEDGHSVVVLDNLERGHKEAVDTRVNFIKADIRNIDELEKIFSENEFDAILHFAGLISVEESTRNPELYEEVNVDGSRNLFSTAIKHGVKRFIFSSTAAIYGNPQVVPIPEIHAKRPTSPYGMTKLRVEEMLSELREKDPEISFSCLRYFNAAGAALDGSMGEGHEPETHIIPLAINAIKEGKIFKLYGTDYDTPDGTCLRDYIHVLDLVEAHKLALEKIMRRGSLPAGRQGYFYNVGTGVGSSNKEVIEIVEKVSGLKMIIEEAERRSGDADRLIADATRIANELGFSPKYSDLQTIIESAWKWHNKS